MKKLFLASVAALSVLSTSVAYTADESDPPLPRFRPWQQVWQCNQLRIDACLRRRLALPVGAGNVCACAASGSVTSAQIRIALNRMCIAPSCREMTER
jgi:hypothetical protein